MATRALGGALLASVAVLQAGARAGGGTCHTLDQMASQTAAINVECCDEPSEDCSGGIPRTCNAGCAELFLPFWRDCRDMLGEQAARFRVTAAQCETGTSPPLVPPAGGGSGTTWPCDGADNLPPAPCWERIVQRVLKQFDSLAP